MQGNNVFDNVINCQSFDIYMSDCQTFTVIDMNLPHIFLKI